ncbi:MAG: hemolysin III family protein [Reichenbachiella sp.]|uniref:PAQR family membrane homeostasis protein TrhA n=1 Tax=Reichenbachiella sp. TaxID=2184521 RepID=UPI0029672DCB|nr:hemolysin III family protein [Reichenbachiella sp.]MDW3210610.1 hemolysin III family protein [Reichenbachiella sp.]
METRALYGFEDPIDSWSHLIGAIAVCILLYYLFKKDGIGRKRPWPVIIYGFSSLFLLSMSGVYHLVSRDLDARYILRIIDHAGIFLMIAGSLISIHMILFKGMLKWIIIILASVIALLGITFGSIYFNELPDFLTHIVFISFGCLGLISVIGILKMRGLLSIKYVVYGGLAYIIGAVIDMFKYPSIVPGYFGPHELFHIAVLMGVAYHWAFLLQSIRQQEQAH